MRELREQRHGAGQKFMGFMKNKSMRPLAELIMGLKRNLALPWGSGELVHDVMTSKIKKARKKKMKTRSQFSS